MATLEQMREKNPKLQLLFDSVKDYLLDQYDNETPIGIYLKRYTLEMNLELTDYEKGIVDSLSILVHEKTYKKIADDAFERIINLSKYSYLIAHALFDSKESLTHNELTNKLHVSKSNLSNAFVLLSSFHLFVTLKVGRNKFYSLSKEGKAFVDFMKQKHSDKWFEYDFVQTPLMDDSKMTFSVDFPTVRSQKFN